MDYSDLWKAIHLVTLKARFMIEKQTDFRKGMDFIRTVRKAKLREFLTPVAKYCKAENIVPLVEHFLLWKEHYVEDETYLAQFNIEKVFGTSLLMYLASMRSNNYEYLRISKKSFSSLFHINNNPNYKVLDIFTDHQYLKMLKENPELYKYLETRRISNKTGKDYAFEPHDERHEEYNKRGMGFGPNKSLQEMKTSFAVADSYHKMRDKVFEEYNIGINSYSHKPRTTRRTFSK